VEVTQAKACGYLKKQFCKEHICTFRTGWYARREIIAVEKGGEELQGLTIFFHPVSLFKL
jgi:hypothetical protein